MTLSFNKKRKNFSKSGRRGLSFSQRKESHLKEMLSQSKEHFSPSIVDILPMIWLSLQYSCWPTFPSPIRVAFSLPIFIILWMTKCPIAVSARTISYFLKESAGQILTLSFLSTINGSMLLPVARRVTECPSPIKDLTSANRLALSISLFMSGRFWSKGWQPRRLVCKRAQRNGDLRLR